MIYSLNYSKIGDKKLIFLLWLVKIHSIITEAGGNDCLIYQTYIFMTFFLDLQKVDVPVMLRHLREQRMFMIQTIAQYKFVYQVLIQFLQNSRLI